jgi:hypothetical protein
MVGLILFILFSFVVFLTWAWVKGINYMQDKHPDYKGEDFLDWDDDKNHTEGKL